MEINSESIRAEIEALVARVPELAAAELIGGPVLTRLSDVTPQRVEWLWPQRIAIGKLNLAFGDPGLGKSFVVLDMSARVSTGSPWPDGCGCAPLGSVILLNCEDELADTIRPRLDKAGADPRKIVALQAIKRPGEGGKMVERSFTLADLPALELAVKQIPDLRLIVIDPVSGYLADSDSHNNAEIRGLLAPLAKLASDYRVAIVMVTHMSKSGGGRAMYRAMGSLAFIAAARSAWVVVPDKDNPKRRLFLPAKNNIGNDETGLAYSIVDGAVAWERQPVTMKADEALAMEMGAAGSDGRPGPAPAERNIAMEWLRELLAGGPMRVGDWKNPGPGTIARAAIEAGFSLGTVRRARQALGIKPRKGQFGDGWYWALPPQGDGVSVQWQTTCAPSDEPAHLPDYEPENATVGLPDAPGFSGGVHLQDNPSNEKHLWESGGEHAQDAQDLRERGEL